MMHMISVKKACVAYDYAQSEGGKDKTDLAVMASGQDMLRTLAAQDALRSAQEMLSIFLAVEIASASPLVWVSKFAAQTTDSAKTFPVTICRAYSFDEITKEAENIRVLHSVTPHVDVETAICS